MYIYIYIQNPVSYIQYGNIAMRDCPPRHNVPVVRGRHGMGCGGVGGIPYGYISILETGH